MATVDEIKAAADAVYRAGIDLSREDAEHFVTIALRAAEDQRLASYRQSRPAPISPEDAEGPCRIEYLRAGYISAIKMWRYLTGDGIKEAKDAIDSRRLAWDRQTTPEAV